jgi:hypothetical protein
VSQDLAQGRYTEALYAKGKDSRDVAFHIGSPNAHTPIKVICGWYGKTLTATSRQLTQCVHLKKITIVIL